MTVSFRKSIVSMGLFLATSYVTARPALGDVLIFKSGETISGEVTRDRDTYHIHTDDGQYLEYDRSQVKKWKKYSRTGLDEARELFNELVELVKPALAVEPPDQRVWLESVRTNTNSYAFTRSWGRLGYDGGAGGWSSGDGHGESEQRSTTARETGIDRVFIGEWGRYIAEFEALAEHPRYAQLTNANRDKNPLYDFHRYPVESQADVAKAVADAIRALKQCVESAKETQAMISRFPVQWLNLDREVRKASDAASDAYRKMSGAYDPNGARHAYNRKERTLDKKITNMLNQVERIANTADIKMAALYSARRTVLTRLQVTAKFLSDAYEAQPELGTPATTPPADQNVRQVSEVLPDVDRLIGIGGSASQKRLCVCDKTQAPQGLAARPGVFVGQDLVLSLHLHEFEALEDGTFRLIVSAPQSPAADDLQLVEVGQPRHPAG